MNTDRGKLSGMTPESELVPVESSMIQAVGYDAAAQVMTVQFGSGKLYEYREVPPDVHQGLMDSGSKGQYMNGNVIDCYPASQVRRGGR